MLDRFEVDLAEHRRRIGEAETQVFGYTRRLDEAFAYEDELNAKQAELDAIEASLAATSRDDAGGSANSAVEPAGQPDAA